MDGLGAAYPPMTVCLRVGRPQPEQPVMYLLVQAYQHLWLVFVHDVYQLLACVAHTILS
jgi:hypothetical protein